MIEHMMFDVVGTTKTTNYAVVCVAVVMLQVLMLCHLCVVAQNLFGLMVMKHELDVLLAKTCCSCESHEHAQKIHCIVFVVFGVGRSMLHDICMNLLCYAVLFCC